LQSTEEKFRSSLREMGHVVDRNLGDGLVLTEAAAAAAQREMSRRKRRLSLTEGDDQWENMVVKDRPKRETNTGLERDHTPLEVVRGRRGGSVCSEQSRGGGVYSERARGGGVYSERSLQSNGASSHRGSATVDGRHEGRGVATSRAGAAAAPSSAMPDEELAA